MTLPHFAPYASSTHRGHVTRSFGDQASGKHNSVTLEGTDIM